LYLYIGCSARGARLKKATATSSRNRVKHELSFGQRLANEAQRAREMAVTLPPGKKRDALLEKARLADLAARINGWLASPELQSQQQNWSAAASHFMDSGLVQLFLCHRVAP
jgi:hypothetical protein